MRFNTANTNTTKTVNLAGGQAFQESPKLAFISLLLTSFIKDQYYRSADDSIQEVVKYIDAIADKRFVAKAAIYARTKFGMRSVSHVVAGEIAKKVKGEQWTKNFFNKIIYRPDDMTEILAYLYQTEKTEANALKKGFAQAFKRFDAYQLAKYKKDGAAVSLIDVVNLVHPRHSEAVEQLIKGTLPTPQTWETKLSKAGKADTEEQKEEQKKEVWVKLIKERKIGYFALLRNLRNVIEQAPEIVPQALELLTDEKLIKGSLVLPFRYVTAIEEIIKLNGKGVKDIIIGLNKALDKSVMNVPKFNGDTLVVLDTSGSMSGQPLQIGALFAAVLVKSNNADYMQFSNIAQYMTLNPLDSTLTLTQMMKQQAFGDGTNFHAIFQEANRAYDRIIILSDMQGWIGYDAPTASFAEYKRRVGANPKIYSFDLQGYGTLQFPENNIFCIAGFSERIFDVMKLLEQDRNTLIAEIEKIEL
jgi:60 kDa SS-A/Ro ribonucleoprotein